jgi:putative ABC transport system permease protein
MIFLAKGQDVIGQTIRIAGVNFKIIGITKSKGGSGFNNPDDVIYVPISVAQKFLVGGNYVSTISVQATSAEDMSNLQAQITSILLERHHISDPQAADFNTLNQADIISTASSVTTTLTYSSSFSSRNFSDCGRHWHHEYDAYHGHRTNA